MKDKTDIKILQQRYYRGETTLTEEQQLRQAYRQGLLSDDPALCLDQQRASCPPEVLRNFQAKQKQNRLVRFRRIRMTVAGIAALFLLLLSLPALFQTSVPSVPDHLKRERFEEALRTIGQVLEEKTLRSEKVIYEDNQIIIAIEQ